MGRVIHFEIHSADPEKASSFYTELFGWEIKEMKVSGVELKDENRYWVVITGIDKEPGINGGILFRRGSAPSDGHPVNAYVCTIEVKNIDESLDKAQKLGGVLTLPKMPIHGVGWLGYCKDPDGNIFGMMQADESAK